MKIGLLKCDTVREELRQIYGDCSDAFIDLFSQYAPEVSLEIYDVQNGRYPRSLDECRGYMTTGSASSVYEKEPWIRRLNEFVGELYKNKVTFVGICFGHQMIAEAIGGKCLKSENGWGVGVKNVRIISKKPWMRPELDSYNLMVSHLDQVCELPRGSEVLGTNEHCSTSMFMVGDHFLGIQGHPEFTAPFAEALLLSRAEKIGRSVVEEARKTLEEKSDREIITRWIVNFFRSR